MRKAIILIRSLLLLSSCADIITLVDSKIYYNYEALIAYEWYNELYKSDTVNYNKPIMLRVNKKGE